jgi:hypothetical protein
MDVEKAKELHAKLKQDICDLLIKFEQETGLYIEDVELNRIWTLGNERSHIDHVEIKCLL